MPASTNRIPSYKPDITHPDDVKLMVDGFYEKVKTDELLGPVFGGQAQVHWEAHLPTMYSFWTKILLGEGEYLGRPFQKHIPLKIDASHFKRWLALFEGTVDSNFEGEMADEAKLRANAIAQAFQAKLGIRPSA